MAINIEWQVKPPGKNRHMKQEQRQARFTMPCKKEEDEVNEERPQMFPRITDSEIIGEQQLAELMASHGVLSRGNAKAALGDLAEVMARLLREGKTVSIPMLGSFKLSIGSDAEIHPDSGRRMQSVVVRGVNFQPAQEFMNAIGKPAFLWKPSTGVAIAPSAAQLIPRLMAYFLTHDSISREAFGRTFGLKRTTAYMRLKELEKMGVIQAVGNGKETVYVNREKYSAR